MRSCLHTVGLAAVAPWLMALSLALSLAPSLAHADAVGPPVVNGMPIEEAARCGSPGSDGAAWIDMFQRGVYGGVCGAAAWFDGLFGNARFDQDSDQTFGRLGLFETYDRRDQLDTSLQLRARYALPNMKNRLRLIVARGDEDQLVEEREATADKPLPQGFQDVGDDAWLLGLGYSKQGNLHDGFDFGIGVRLSTPIDPYVKGTYRHNFVFGPNTMLRFRETPFWRDSRGFGATTQLALDHLATDNVLLRWNNSATVAQDTEALDWTSSITAYQSLRQRRAISYTALVQGETGADVPLQNYGVVTTYRQPVFRKWLFLELSGSLTWPKDTVEEEREINPGVGLGFEMYFGPVDDIDLR